MRPSATSWSTGSPPYRMWREPMGAAVLGDPLRWCRRRGFNFAGAISRPDQFLTDPLLLPAFLILGLGFLISAVLLPVLRLTTPLRARFSATLRKRPTPLEIPRSSDRS